MGMEVSWSEERRRRRRRKRKRGARWDGSRHGHAMGMVVVAGMIVILVG